MAGSSGSCSFVKQEKIESENYSSESRSSGGDLDTNCQNEDLNDEMQNEKTGKSSTASPVYQKLCKKSAGQLSNQQPDSQSSNNNNSIKMGNASKKSHNMGDRNLLPKTTATTKVCLTPPIINTEIGKNHGNLQTSSISLRETQRVSPRQLTSTPAQALQALHGSQNSGGRGRSPASNNMITSNINSDGLPNFNHENSNASSNMVAAASAALSAAAALDPLLQVMAESRTIYKVKRFLSTLVQFGNDISSETGDRVKELIFNLVAGTVSVNDFHQVLQDVTNFPLRPFVLPFLKANIPLLSREITALATITNQTPIQYLRSHQHLLIESTRSAGNTNSIQASQIHEPNDIFHSSTAERENSFANMSHGKKRSNSGSGMVVDSNNSTSNTLEDYSAASSHKRPRSENGKQLKENIPSSNLPGLHRDSMPLQGITNTGGGIRRSHQPLHWVYPQPQQQNHHQRNAGAWNNSSLSMTDNSLDLHHALHAHGNTIATSGITNHSLVGNNNVLESSSSQILRTSGGPPPSIKNGAFGSSGNASNISSSDNDDEWKNIHVMLNCILGMVDKTKKALSILQQRNIPQSTSPTASHKVVQGNFNTRTNYNNSPPSTSTTNHGTQNGVNDARNGTSNLVSSMEGVIGATGHGEVPYVGEGGSDAFVRSKIPVSDMLAATLRSTEERVVEVRRRAEEAVLEVKRVAMAEMQRAVTLAERRALDSVTNERIKMERLLIEAASMSGVPSGSISSTSNITTNLSRKQEMNILDAAAINTERLNRNDKNCLDTVKSNSSEDYSANLNDSRQNETSNAEEISRAVKNKAPGSNQTTATICWNCGRTANETCSGCNLARYCSQFCQHKDWELHHKVCSITAAEVSSGQISAPKSIGSDKNNKPLASVMGNSVAATLAAAGFNLHEETESNDTKIELKTVSNSRSSDNITAATLLAAAAAHAAASSASTKTLNQTDCKDVDENEKRCSPQEDKDKHMEVNVDEDEDDAEIPRAHEKEEAENMTTNKRNSTPHDMSQSHDYDENRIEPLDNNNKVRLSAESDLSSSPQTSSFDKHRRKCRKQEISKEIYQ